ncbi:MAG: hypothetical protein QOJ03_2440 [Frankiaceae bacterium]|nr:hypothetical protein [Frankiaceae bacterium]
MIRRLALVAALALAASACGGSSTPEPSTTRAALHGAVPNQDQPRPSFQLVDTAGKPYDFAARTKGRVTFLYFGYTHCPDECPTSMADVAAALRRVGPTIADQVSVVFVTTDPWRDTKPVLRTWLDRFSPAFVGLTGSPTQIAGAEVQMGMPISKRVAAPRSHGSGRYAVDHFAAVMAYGRDDRLAAFYPSGVSPGDIATDLQVLVKG